MAITNPPSKRKHLSSSSNYLYIKDTDNWAVTNPKTIAYKWSPSGAAGCFLLADSGDYYFDDGSPVSISVNSSGEITSVIT